MPQHGGYFHDLTLRENLKAISEIVIKDKKLRDEKINLLISKFELEPLQNIKAEFLIIWLLIYQRKQLFNNF